jgi:predicted nucleic acid-binding protein
VNSLQRNIAFVDTNVLLRWLLGDHKELSARAEALVQGAASASLLVTDIIVAEVVYVLRSTGRDRRQTGEALLLIGRTAAFKYENEELVSSIISLLADTKLDFADCYLLARARREKLGLETFDNSLRKKYLV